MHISGENINQCLQASTDRSFGILTHTAKTKTSRLEQFVLFISLWITNLGCGSRYGNKYKHLKSSYHILAREKKNLMEEKILSRMNKNL